MDLSAYVFSSIACVMGAFALLRVKPPYGFFLWLPKAFAGALAPIGLLLGSLGIFLGVLTNAYPASVLGALGVMVLLVVIRQVIRPSSQMEAVFSTDLSRNLPAGLKANSIKQRRLMRRPGNFTPRLEQDLVFAVLPGSGRQLKCDLWQPAIGVQSSGLAFLYFHGSAWYLFDKDFGTRPFFRHLTAQGHVVMDVAYRLFPEVGVLDMVCDVKRAVAWMKAHASEYAVDPQRIVLGGGSAGGHISLLAAFAPQHARMTPEELQDVDLSVRAVVSCYGPTDLAACYEHTGQSRLIGKPSNVSQMTQSELRNNAGRLDLLMGGHPHEIPAEYARASPVSYVSPSCPPTLLLQGDQDWVTPIKATCEMAVKLNDAGVKVVNIVVPFTNHAFDLILPQVSPSAQSAWFEIDRFLTCVTYDSPKPVLD